MDIQLIFNIFSQSPVKRKGVFVKLNKKNSFLLTRMSSLKQSEVENIVRNSDKESDNSKSKFDQEKETKLWMNGTDFYRIYYCIFVKHFLS